MGVWILRCGEICWTCADALGARAFGENGGRGAAEEWERSGRGRLSLRSGFSWSGGREDFFVALDAAAGDGGPVEAGLDEVSAAGELKWNGRLWFFLPNPSPSPFQGAQRSRNISREGSDSNATLTWVDVWSLLSSGSG